MKHITQAMQTPPLNETATEATLELTLLSIDGHFPRSFLAKQNPSVSAWVDPAHKRSTTPRNCVLHLPLSSRHLRNCVLHLPLSSRHLRNPSSHLTLQILSPRSPFKPFRSSGAASASVYLSSLPISGDPVTLHLRRPSGRVAPSVSFSVRILWSLVPDLVSSDSGGFGVEETGLRLEPSAPPLLEPESRPDEKWQQDGSAWRNFLLGALSGAAAVILVNVIRQH